MAESQLYALLAEFAEPEQLVEAARQVHRQGYRRFESYSPFPVEGLAEAMEFRHTRISMVVLTGGIVGCVGGFFFQWWVNTVAYPINIGGRPFNSWPAFIPVTFEMTILGAALSAVLGMLALNGLPRPHHPLFAVPQFADVTENRFFLSVLAADPEFDEEVTRNFLQSLKPLEVIDVPA